MQPHAFCGVSERLATKELPAEAAKMPTKRPTWCLQASLGQFTDSQLRQILADAFGRWSVVCDVIFAETNDRIRANFLIIDRDFGDGPSGVLADCQLPHGGQQLMRLDNATKWVASKNPPQGTVDITAVSSHEMGHGIGLMHLPAGGQADLMEPFYRPGLQDPQAAESAMVRQWYGAPVAVTPPTVPGTPASMSGFVLDLGGINSQGLTINRMEVSVGGKKYLASGIAKEAKAGQLVTGGLE